MSLLAGDPGPCFFKRGITVSKLWEWFSGKKLAIAGLVFLIQQTILPIWFGENIPPVLDKVFLTLGALFGFLGVGHKAVKAIPSKPGTPRIEVK